MRATAFVLAAGLGTRLRPLTEHRPKALVPVAGAPMLDWTLAHLRRHGHRDVLVNAHHHREAILAWSLSRGVQVIEEPEILGTGGGLLNARERLADRFVVVNADVVSDVDLDGLLGRVPEGGAAMALRVHGDAVGAYGLVAADASGRVVRLVDVASAEAEGPIAQDTHFTGLHALDRSALDLLPDGFSCIVRTAYKALVPARRVAALRHTGVWIDVGDPGAYLAANLAVLTRRSALPRDPHEGAAFAVTAHGATGARPPGTEVEGVAWIGVDARLGHDVRLRDTVVGARATVRSGAHLERCVVWDGCEAPPGRWHDTVFHDGGTLSLSPPSSDTGAA